MSKKHEHLFCKVIQKTNVKFYKITITIFFSLVVPFPDVVDSVTPTNSLMLQKVKSDCPPQESGLDPATHF